MRRTRSAHAHGVKSPGASLRASPRATPRASPTNWEHRDVHVALHVGLAHQVLKACAAKGLHVAPQLALEAVRLLFVDPANHRARPDATCTDADPERPPREHPVCAACVRFLLDEHAPGLAATRMRIAFRRKYKTPEDIAAGEARGMESRVAPLLAEVMSDVPGDGPAVSPRPDAVTQASGAATRAGKASTGRGRGDRAHKDRLYGSVVAAAVLRSGLGSPANPAVIKEAHAALQSVYPPKELPNLLRLPTTARRAQLLEVCRISAGVRIFNWDCGARKAQAQADHSPSHVLPDLPALVRGAAAVTQDILRTAVEGVESRLWPATAALEAIYLQRASPGHGDSPGSAHHPDIDLDLLKETVIYLRQQQVLLRRLLEDVDRVVAESRRLTEQLEAGLAEVHAAVHSKTAVPTNQVYPQFMSLASTWEALGAQAVVVSRAANLHRRLDAYTRGVRTMDDAVINGILEAQSTYRKAPTDAERVSAELPDEAVGGLSEKQLEAARRCLARDLGRGDVVTEMQGFCPWFLAVSAGGLVPGRPALGLCEVAGAAGAGGSSATHLYALSSLEAAQLFSTDPNKWIRRSLEEARRRPALVGLLGLRDVLQPPPCSAAGDVKWPLLGASTSGLGASLPTADAGVQTEAMEAVGVVTRGRTRRSGSVAVHIRMPALPLATSRRVRPRTTQSTQTAVSSYRKENQVQTSPPRDAAVQCPRTVACSTDYVAGPGRLARRVGPPTVWRGAESRALSRQTSSEEVVVVLAEFHQVPSSETSTTSTHEVVESKKVLARQTSCDEVATPPALSLPVEADEVERPMLSRQVSSEEVVVLAGVHQVPSSVTSTTSTYEEVEVESSVLARQMSSEKEELVESSVLSRQSSPSGEPNSAPLPEPVKKGGEGAPEH